MIQTVILCINENEIINSTLNVDVNAFIAQIPKYMYYFVLL